MTQNYFESAPKLTAAAGAVFDATKDTSGINFQAEMKSSLNVAEQTGQELSKMREFANQMKERALADGGEMQAPQGNAAGFAIQEGMSYATVAIATAINPALGMIAGGIASANTVRSIASRTSEQSSFTAPEDMGKGSKADAKTEESVFSSGGSATSLQAVAQSTFVDGGMQAPSFMPSSDDDKPVFTKPFYGSEAAYDQMYSDMISNGQTPDDVLAMSIKFEEDQNYVAMQRQYQQHAVIRPQNLQMVASAPSVGLS